MRSPRLAAVLSAVFPGLGQFYNRQWFKGFGFLIVSVVLTQKMAEEFSIEIFLEGDRSGTAKGLGMLLTLMGLLIWSMVDAYRSAKTSSPKE